jgi:hypothetical protein
MDHGTDRAPQQNPASAPLPRMREKIEADGMGPINQSIHPSWPLAGRSTSNTPGFNATPFGTATAIPPAGDPVRWWGPAGRMAFVRDQQTWTEYRTCSDHRYGRAARHDSRILRNVTTRLRTFPSQRQQKCLDSTGTVPGRAQQGLNRTRLFWAGVVSRRCDPRGWVRDPGRKRLNRTACELRTRVSAFEPNTPQHGTARHGATHDQT